MSVAVDTDGVARLPALVEATLYFCCMEAVQNAAKHSQADQVSVRVNEEPDRWWLTVTDDGIGFDQTHTTATTGVGLVNMRDRLDAVGGTVEVVSERTGTTVTAVVPRTNEAVGDQAVMPLPHPVG